MFALGGSPAGAQGGPEGPYAAAQADRGEALFREICGSCHTASQFSGAAFARAWTGTTAYDFFTLVRTTMPYDSPGQLRREEYADVVAYVLRLNGLPAGARELPSDDAALRRVKIDFSSPE
jgi:mono/diheme cytochrome c family protein